MMTRNEKGHGVPYFRWFFAAVCLFFAFIYYYLSVIDIDFYDSRLPSLGPGPDGQEYFGAAMGFVRDGDLKIRIGDEILPSRYPPGFPATIVPFTYLLGGDDIVLAPYMANRTLGILIILSIFGFFLYLGRYYAAGISAVLLSTLPSFVSYSRSSMSENLGAFLILWTYLLTYLALKKDNGKLLALAGFVLGLAVTTRVALVLFGTVLAAVFLINHRKGLQRNLTSALIIAACFIAGAAPTLLQNWANFGNPLTTGYTFWMPTLFNSFSYASFENVLVALWQEVSLQRDVYITTNIFGTGTHFTPLYFFVCLVAILHMLCRPSREKLIIAGSLLITIVVLASYDFIHLRKYYPHQVLSICLVANFYQTAVDAVAHLWRKSRLRGSGIVLGCIATISFMVAGYPSQSGWKVGELRVQIIDLLNRDYLGRMDNRYEPIRRLPEYLSGEQGLVIVQTRNVNVILANSLLPRSLTVIPEDGNHRYRHSKHWRLGKEEVDDYTRAALTVYGL